MTLKNKNPWKYLSVGLLGVIAIGLFAPAQAEPGGALSGWQLAVDDLQTQVNAAVGNVQGQIDALVLALAGETSAREAADIQLAADLATEASDRAAADTAEATARAADVDAEESRALAAEAGIASDLADHETADGDLSDTNEIQSISGTGSVDLSDGGGSVSCEDITGDTSLCDSDDANTTYDETDFATSGQSCIAGKVVTGVDVNGAVTCATDEDTTYSGSDFATSSQDCAAGKVVTGVDASGNVKCATDDRTVYWTHASDHIVLGQLLVVPNIHKIEVGCAGKGFPISGMYALGLPTLLPFPEVITTGLSDDRTAWVFKIHNPNLEAIIVNLKVLCASQVTDLIPPPAEDDGTIPP